MTGRKVEVLEGELGQLKTDFEEKISDFQNQFSSIHEKMDGRFAALEDLMKKMIDNKQKPASSETIGGHGRGGNPNPLGGRENPEVEVLEGDDGMPPLEPLSREELSQGYDRREADYVGRREEFYRRGAGFERIQRRGADFEGEGTDFHRRGADFERSQRRGADFEGRREEMHRRGADFERIQRRGPYLLTSSHSNSARLWESRKMEDQFYVDSKNSAFMVTSAMCCSGSACLLINEDEWENPLMGWTSTGDPYANVGDAALSFDSEDAAKAFAERHGWDYQVKKRHTPLLKVKAYADNFKWKGLPQSEEA
ncbi:hypothetical protein M5K25_001286 [Dendrobium thyrsiflorum]|uniref:NADH dehydrogenase [ubiquinone] iron-sulfur protein 4, mitochondrial n=1 Tax=Dendrobium thyrsiflorum TaxID=117978 RepID=A0ABD0VYR1_DENTH